MSGSINGLPALAYAKNPNTGRTIGIRRGRSGTYESCVGGTVETLNRTLGVSDREAAAMLAGSRWGWDDPATDPNHYTANEARFLIGLPALENA